MDIFTDAGELTREAIYQIYQQALSPMRIVDHEFNILLQNPAMDRLTQFPSPHTSGKKCYEVARSRENCNTDQCPVTLVRKGQKRVEQYYHCELWNGKTFPAWVLVTPFYSNDGRTVLGSLQVVRDESHVLAFSEAIEKKNKELEKNYDLIQAYNEIILALNEKTNLGEMADAVLRLFVHHTAALMGVVYRLDETGKHLVPLASYALDTPPSSFSFGKGLPGEVAGTRRPVFLDNVPDDYFLFSSGTGRIRPAHLACLPIDAADHLMGVLELASFQSLKDKRPFLEDVARQLGIAMQNGLTLERTIRLAENLKATNERIEAQNEELKAQSEELIAQSEEIQSQTEELTAQRDILERKTLEADEANRMKSAFLSNMSHELRTPLNAILGLARLTKDGTAGSLTEQQEQYLDVILRNGKNLLELINDILDLARIEAGREELRFDVILLRGFLETLAGTMRTLAERKGLIFQTDIAPEVETMISDERKLGQILTNLLDNAIKFTEKGSVSLSVKIREQASQDLVLFDVADTGIGMDPGFEDIIFEPFRQIDASATRKYGGSGLGLSICDRLAALLGGKIRIESQRDKGSVFTLEIPRDRRTKHRLPDDEWRERLRRMLLPENTPVKKEERSISLAKLGGEISDAPHIFLIDDDMVAVRELGVHLREAGYRVSFSLDARTGLRQLEEYKPDLLLLDIMMPDMDGYGVLDEMRRNPAIARTPVLFLTALDVDKKTYDSLPPNVRGVLLKGEIVPEQLLRQITNIVGSPPRREAKTAPTHPENQQISDPEVSPPEGRPRPGGHRILIAEDNSDNLFYLTELLRSSGYEIFQARDGKEAVETALEELPDLILMDIQMPKMSGLEAVGVIRDDVRLQNIPIIALTARAMKGDREKILEAGCDGYIPKPVDADAVFTVLKKWLRSEGQGVKDTDS